MAETDEATKLRQAFEDAGQGHVFAYFDELNDGERRSLLDQAREIDPGEIDDLYDSLVRRAETSGLDASELEPAPYDPLPSSGGDVGLWTEAKNAGEAALREGKVAAFTVAGGQGTRLGFDGPKGTLGVSPVTGRSLFQIFAEKLLRSGERFGVDFHWFILTSELNHNDTVAFFRRHAFFGMAPEHVHFVPQGTMPAVDYSGKIILADKATIARAPDGHGGSLRALHRSGAVEEMKRLGIEAISYFQVDNPLVQCIDPAFVGFHFMRGSELSSKMVPKAYPGEKVGHFCLRNGEHVVIEYSDMPEELAESRDADGQLRFRAGSVAIHIFDLGFVERVGGGRGGERLPFHRADKKIPYVDESGETVKPEEPNGVKFEMFVFDALPKARNPVIIEASRAYDFSPVKNATGVDSVETCVRDQLRMFALWLDAAGETVDADEQNVPHAKFEISPRFAVDEADFIVQWDRLATKPEIEAGVVVE